MEERAQDHFELVLYVLIGDLKIILNIVCCQIPADLLNHMSECQHKEEI